MKRNWDTIRKILLTVESIPDVSTQLTNSDISDKTGIDIQEASYHCKLMIDAGLIDGSCRDYIGGAGTSCLINRLTWDGHEFLDKIRNENVWNSMKTTLRKNGIDMSFDLAKTLATNIISKLIVG